MRVLATIAAMLALIGPAAADDPRYTPPVGSKLTYRLLTTTGAPGGDNTVTVGEIHRLTIATSDGRSAEGVITPLAVLMRCPDSRTSTDCRQARNYPDISRDGDLIAIPIPAAIGAEMAKIAKLRSRDIFEAAQTLPVMGAKDLEEIEKPEIGAAPLFVLTSEIECDEKLLDGFFPLGTLPQVSVPCKSTVERSRSRWPIVRDGTSSNAANYQLSFAGRHRITTPFGEFDAATIKYTIDGGDKGPVVDGQIDVVEKLGASANLTTILHLPNSPNVTTTERALIKFEP